MYLARRGRRVAAVIDADDLEQIVALAEDMSDILAAESARAEMRASAETPIPRAQVKADLGLTRPIGSRSRRRGASAESKVDTQVRRRIRQRSSSPPPTRPRAPAGWRAERVREGTHRGTDALVTGWEGKGADADLGVRRDDHRTGMEVLRSGFEVDNQQSR